LNWKPFARLCGVCGLSLAVVVGEEPEHVHVETYASAPAFTTNLYTAATSAAVLNRRLL
jgi:hypothetical protein